MYTQRYQLFIHSSFPLYLASLSTCRPLLFYHHFSPILSHFRSVPPRIMLPPTYCLSLSSLKLLIPFFVRHFSSGSRHRSPSSRSRCSRGAFPSCFSLSCLWPWVTLSFCLCLLVGLVFGRHTVCWFRRLSGVISSFRCRLHSRLSFSLPTCLHVRECAWMRMRALACVCVRACLLYHSFLRHH